MTIKFKIHANYYDEKKEASCKMIPNYILSLQEEMNEDAVALN